jgi:adenosylcobinamide-GDP ribazoletransferase
MFLTTLNVRVTPYPDMEEIGRSSWAFPLVGGLIGLLLVLAHGLLGGHLGVWVTALVVTALWVILTGGLHLDGWTDCWDALAASTSRERRYEILKDSRLGTFGALGLFLLVFAKIATLAREDPDLGALFLAPIIGRGVMVYLCSGLSQTGRGMGSPFLDGLDSTAAFRAVGITLGAVVLVSGLAGIVWGAAALLAAWCFRQFAESRLGMVNGDVMGGMCEFAEVTVLLASSWSW